MTPVKQSSSELSSLAAEVLNDPNSTARERRLAASVLSQDETKGQYRQSPWVGDGVREYDED